jgi:hypothetical protein
MFQTDNAAGDIIAQQAADSKSFFDSLKGLSFDDALSTIANGIVHFSFKVLIAILVFYVGKFIIKKIYGLVRSIMVNRKVDASLTTFVLSLVNMLLFFILIITIIGILGIETSSFIAIFASAGVAIGMALSGTLQNFAGGVLILLIKPYKVGDLIEVQGFTGTVKEIQIFNTVINTADNKQIIIPNGGLSTGTINNYSKEDYRRVEWKVGLSYGNDAGKAKEVILGMLDEEETVIKDNQAMPPFVGLGELADSSIVFTVRAWVKSGDYWTLFFRMNERFYNELPEKGFAFPFPQLDVHLTDVPEGMCLNNK